MNVCEQQFFSLPNFYQRNLCSPIGTHNFKLSFFTGIHWHFLKWLIVTKQTYPSPKTHWKLLIQIWFFLTQLCHKQNWHRCSDLAAFIQSFLRWQGDDSIKMTETLKKKMSKSFQLSLLFPHLNYAFLLLLILWEVESCTGGIGGTGVMPWRC